MTLGWPCANSLAAGHHRWRDVDAGHRVEIATERDRQPTEAAAEIKGLLASPPIEDLQLPHESIDLAFTGGKELMRIPPSAECLGLAQHCPHRIELSEALPRVADLVERLLRRVVGRIASGLATFPLKRQPCQEALRGPQLLAPGCIADRIT